MIGDEKNAFFHTPQTEKSYCEMNDDIRNYHIAKGHDVEDMVMVLDKQLYGQREASVAHNKFLVSIYTDKCGFERSPAQPQYLFHRGTKTLGEIHQEDVELVGPEEAVIKSSE